MFNKDTFTPFRPNQIGEQLPYLEFNEDESSPLYRVHLLKDGGLGICWQCPIPASYSYDGGVESTINELRTYLESLPEAYESQLIITSHNNLTKPVEKYLSANPDMPRAQVLRQSRADKIMESGFRGYKVSERGYTRLRETYVIITMRAPEQTHRFGLFKVVVDMMFQSASLILTTLGMDMSKYVGKFLEETLRVSLADFREALMSAENNLGGMFDLRRMTLEELKEHYWQAYAPSYKDPRQKITIDKRMAYSDQMFPLPIEHEHHIIKVGNDYHGLIMMAMMPDHVHGDFLSSLRRTLVGQTTYFCNFTSVNQLIEKMSLTLSSALKKRVASAFNREDAEAYAQEASEVKSRLFTGRKIMYCMVGLMVHGYSREQVEEDLLRVNAVLKKMSIVPDIEKGMALQGISYSWPLVWRKEYSNPFARTRRVLSDDISDLNPVHGHWGGHGQIGTKYEKNAPQCMYVNRDGEITFFDHTSPDFMNWHYAITGTSGSGKSFVVADLTLQLFSAGIEKQYLMTIKDDYDRFGETMGKLIIIDVDRQDVCINPFTGEMNKHRLQQWSTTVEMMIQKGNFETSRIEQRLIEQVVQYAYDIVPSDDVLRPTWIQQAFQKFPYSDSASRDAGMQMAQEIGSYCEGGIYGYLFDAPPSFSEKDKLVVFNLQNVLNEKIADVIINSLFVMIDNVMYLGNRGEKKHLLVDEMVSMISSKGGPTVANQLKRAFRTYRSLNCMCGISSQNEEDLTTEVGQAIIGNITKRIMLKPRREMIPMLMQTLGLKSERHAGNVGSLITAPGFFSEFYLMSPHGEVVCRLIPDPLTYAMATTTPDDVAEVKRLKEELNTDWWKATVEFSRRYPHGVRAARAAAQK
ncbi:MAG: hypothetical protein COY40_06100 [Alphaproteobacteria bacterium CG_4_10_14_0_8_um_filter_53_9]|nr:MAG: hypothetical protein COY40_06100 [Alphaproteobacteria bacterium CG_4_10_14_0_8_um_filter_53_9]